MLGHKLCGMWTCGPDWTTLSLALGFLPMRLNVGECGISRWKVGREWEIASSLNREGLIPAVAGYGGFSLMEMKRVTA